MTLGERIAYHRNRLGLSQGELAGRMNVSRQAVSKWETDGCLPDLDRLISLSGLFGITLDELVKGEEQEPADPAAAESPGAPAPRPAAQGQRTVGYVLLGVGLAMQGQFTVGMIMAFQGFLSSFMAPAMTLVSAGQTLQEMRTQMERVDDVMEYPETQVFRPES